jgi:tetratricopeptide (TPR) repeat protein
VAYGGVLLQEGKRDSARLYFDQALEKTKSKNADILLAVANAHIEEKAGDANYAIELLNKAFKRKKNGVQLYTALGNAYRKLDNGSEAYKAYQQALNADGNYAAAKYQLGKIFATQKNEEMYLKFYNEVLARDSMYAPVYYGMYYHYYFKEPAKAMDYFKRYMAKSDYDPQNEYAYTDLLYLNKQYDAAISRAQELISKGDQKSAPRLNKLIAYSYKDQHDSLTALQYMNRYFATAADSDFVQKDYEMMGEIYASLEGKKDSAGYYFQKAVSLEKDSTARIAAYLKLSELYKSLQDYSGQALWLGKYADNNPRATNVDLFNWGLAHYRAKEYPQSDSVFARYMEKYPEQTFGYYWRARSSAGIDTAMTAGLAVPHYTRLVEMLEKDTTANATNKKWLIEAYGYLAAYKTNTQKDYAAALGYFEKVLALDPDNADVKKYIAILKKNLGGSKETSKAAGKAEAGAKTEM